MFEKIKNMYDAALLPYGVNKEFDALCNDSLMKFIDRVYNILLFFYLFAAVGSIYFFTKHEILNVS